MNDVPQDCGTSFHTKKEFDMETNYETRVYPLYMEEVANPGKKMLVGVLAKNGDCVKRKFLVVVGHWVLSKHAEAVVWRSVHCLLAIY